MKRGSFDCPMAFLRRSAQRFLDLVRLRGPRVIIDNEVRLMVHGAAALVGPDQVRRWADEVTERSLAALHDPG